jgi:hypothetical protein
MHMSSNGAAACMAAAAMDASHAVKKVHMTKFAVAPPVAPMLSSQECNQKSTIGNCHCDRGVGNQ